MMYVKMATTTHSTIMIYQKNKKPHLIDTVLN